jgi:hypothetical protein
MDQVVAASVRSGFAVRQTRTGTWVFVKGIETLIFQRTPRTSREWMYMINSLRGAGLRLPHSGD